jgi:hypothetical protein
MLLDIDGVEGEFIPTKYKLNLVKRSGGKGAKHDSEKEELHRLLAQNVRCAMLDGMTFGPAIAHVGDWVREVPGLSKTSDRTVEEAYKKYGKELNSSKELSKSKS